MAGDQVGISQAGGPSDGPEALGTDAFKILSAINEVWCEDGVLLLMDVGSSVMSAEIALEMLPERQRRKCLLSNAPLVEGAIVAALHASLGEPLQSVNAVAEAALSAPNSPTPPEHYTCSHAWTSEMETLSSQTFPQNESCSEMNSARSPAQTASPAPNPPNLNPRPQIIRISPPKALW